MGFSLGPAAPAEAGCPPDSVESGPICIDKYEASVWDLSGLTGTAKAGELVEKIKKGTVTQENLIAAGAIQRGVGSDDYGAGCPATGNGCVNFYAVSIPGVTPSRFITWFQAVAAARNSGKRLPTNAEWQAAALGTPATGGADNGATTCNTDYQAGGVTPTGSRTGCVSDMGAFDMVGNLWEWVADWVPRSTACADWGAFSDDFMCLAGASTDSGPGALIRGGTFPSASSPGSSRCAGAASRRTRAASSGFARRASRPLTLCGLVSSPAGGRGYVLKAALFAPRGAFFSRMT